MSENTSYRAEMVDLLKRHGLGSVIAELMVICHERAAVETGDQAEYWNLCGDKLAELEVVEWKAFVNCFGIPKS